MNRRSRTWGLEISTERMAGGIVLTVAGRIGSVTSPAFAEAVSAALAAAPRLILDLTEVDYVSGVAVRILQHAAATNDGHTILCGLQNAVRITLTLSGALDRVVVVNSRKEALESLITHH